MNYFRQIRAIVWKDLVSEFRTKEMLSAMLIFSFLVIVIFAFAFDPARETTRAVFPGIIWVGISFAAILGLNRSFLAEKENDSLLGLMLAPCDRSVIYFAKVIGNLILVWLVILISMPLYFIFFNFQWTGSILTLVLIIFLSTLGFISVGTFLAALAANTRTSEILLPIIVFPIAVPVIIAAVESTGIVLGSVAYDGLTSWLMLLILYDVVFLAVPFVLFDYVLEV
jgi:heme exporter protein B